MAKTVISLSDPITSIVNKSNTISNDLGDVSQLSTGDSNVVDAINSVRQLISPFDDSAEIIAIGLSGISVTNAGGLGSISYDSATGEITYNGPSDANLRSYFSATSPLTYDSSTGQFGLINNFMDSSYLIDSSIGASKFANVAPLKILDSDGGVLKIIYGPTS